MARFNYETANNYGSQSNGSFFSLKNDRDVARVRFMYNSMADVEGLAVHKVKLGDKERYVNCLRDYRDPVDVCPLCQAKYSVIPKVFVSLYDVDADEVKIWDRGKTFFDKIAGLCSRYSPLVGHEFEIERHGAKGDQKTTYEIFPVGDQDNTRIEDLPEMPTILGGLVMDKTAQEMNEYLEIGSFPDETSDVQQSGGRASRNDEVRRRTPSRTGRDIY